MDGINLKQAPSPAKNVHSNFDLSFNRKFDLKFGQLFPFLMEPVMPGDNYKISYNYLLRMAPFVSQVFQKYIVAFDYYYVPNRIVYRNFDNFMTGGYDGKQTYIHPYLDLGYLREAFAGSINVPDSIFGALDIPSPYYQYAQRKEPSHYINAIPFFAYLRVYLDYWLGTNTSLNSYKETMLNNKYLCLDGDNSDLFNSLYNDIRRGGQSGASYNYELLPRLYPLDYFTEARPDPQLGPVMTIPLSLVNTDINGTSTFKLSSDVSASGSGSISGIWNQGSDYLTLFRTGDASRAITINGSVFNNTATIPDFYSAARVQEFLTLMGFSGFSPEDTIAAEFGVKNKDERLSKSEFLFHDQHVVEIGEVFSNSVNVPNATQGATEFNDIPGVGTAIGKSNNGSRGFQTYIPEHGFIVGLCSVYPEAQYSEGIPRIYHQLDRLDYPHPMFAELGMQSIKQKEICANYDYINWDNDFAYTPRYSEYKVHVNRLNGALQNSLNYMTGGRRFLPLPNTSETWVPPAFNDNFLRVLPGKDHLNRTFNVTSNYPYDKPLFLDIQNNIYANRQLPYYGLPKFGF